MGDESLEARLIAVLRNEGHAVLSIHERSHGMSDDGILALSVELNWPVITNDKDFGELVFRKRQPSVGVIFLRFPITPTLVKADILVSWLRINEQLVMDHIVVLGPRSARVRRLDPWVPS